MHKLYYQAPSDKIFNEVKEKAIELWETKYPREQHPNYTKKKVEYVKNINNIEDNIMTIIAMFNPINQNLLASMLPKETRKEIAERLKSVGAFEEIIFN